MSKQRPVTLREVAAKAGVSVSTASRILQGLSTGRGDAAARVHAAVKALGYRPNVLLASLASRRFHLDQHDVGLPLAMVSWPRHRVVERMLQNHAYVGFERASRAMGYAPRFLPLGLEEPLERVTAQLRAEGVAGIAFSDVPSDRSVLRAVNWSSFSLVLLDRPLAELSCDEVRPAVFENVLTAFRQLERCGARRIGAVFGQHEGGHPDDIARAAAAAHWEQTHRGHPPSFYYQMPQRLDLEEIRVWRREHRVDAILGFPGTVLEMLRAAEKGMFPDLLLASTAVTGRGQFTGMVERQPDLGELACKHLDVLIRRKIQGGTEDPVRMTLQGRWFAPEERPGWLWAQPGSGPL